MSTKQKRFLPEEEACDLLERERARQVHGRKAVKSLTAFLLSFMAEVNSRRMLIQ